MPSPLILATINARFSHASPALRALKANLGPLREQCQILEFTLQQPVSDMLEQLLRGDPWLIGLGVYVWNVELTAALVEQLKAVRPQVKLVLGGPEVTHGGEGLPFVALADHVVRGEGELAFRALAEALARGEQPPRVVEGGRPALDGLLPSDAEYSDADLRHRLVYVEASRGCPFGCAFCLSCRTGVRNFPLESFLESLDRLISRGVRSLKFVDRTFNLEEGRAVTILSHLAGRWHEGLQLHFEVVPDRVSEGLLQALAAFPPGAVQLEVGVQTFDPEVSRAIGRPLQPARVEQAFAALKARTGVHLHADLLVGLPGGDLEEVRSSFNRLLSLGPDDIQVGILKCLRGTPLEQLRRERGLVFSARPPYEILCTPDLDFFLMQRLKRFARYFELFHNGGNLREGMEALLQVGPTPFDAFLAFSDQLYAQTGQTHQLALVRQFQAVFEFLVGRGSSPKWLAQALLRDWDRPANRRDRPEFLRPYVSSLAPVVRPSGEGWRKKGRRGPEAG